MFVWLFVGGCIDTNPEYNDNKNNINLCFENCSDHLTLAFGPQIPINQMFEAGMEVRYNALLKSFISATD